MTPRPFNSGGNIVLFQSCFFCLPTRLFYQGAKLA